MSISKLMILWFFFIQTSCKTTDLKEQNTAPLPISNQAAKPLNEQVAIVWGASQGIGSAIAVRLAKEGAHVMLVARTEANLQKVSSSIREQGGIADYFVADITDKKKVEEVTQQIIKAHKRVDILVQNVGIYPREDFDTMSEQFFDHVMKTNLVSNLYTLQAVLPTMQLQKYGRILIVSSITGTTTGIPGLSAYSASKGAIKGMIKTVAIEQAPYGITLNSIEPGYVQTEGLAHLPKDYFRKVSDSIPLGRTGSTEEIAAAAFFMVHPDASYITGTSLIVDGGLTLPESHYLHVRKPKKRVTTR